MANALDMSADMGTDPGVRPGAYVRRGEDGISRLDAVIETLDCPSCVPALEAGLRRLPGLRRARVNAGQRRLRLEWRTDTLAFERILAALETLGHRIAPFDSDRFATRGVDEEGRALLRALAVAGFAFANVMLISVAVWAGLAQDMGPGTRAFLHWVSALIALPAIVFAALAFYRSAFGALRAGAMNMDVPIALAVTLAAGMSLLETMRNGPHVYYDAALGLLFFLLIGRFLDRNLRGRAFAAAQNLLALRSLSALVLGPDGCGEARPIEAVLPGDLVMVAAGETVPVDGVVLSGTSELDTSLVTGETVPVRVRPGSSVHAGTVNLSGVLRVETRAAHDATLLSGIAAMMDSAEQAKGRFVRLADRVARLYAPVVHLLAFAAFVFWFAIGALDWRESLMISVAVLIVTCPCALALAVPAVQVGAVGRLLKRGVYVSSGDALERLRAVDTIVFDKTGTLTFGTPVLDGVDGGTRRDRAVASALGALSRHPLARALTASVAHGGADCTCGDFHNIREIPGDGIEAVLHGETLRLGRRAWVGGPAGATAGGHDGPEIWFRRGAHRAIRFRFSDRPRGDAAAVIAALKRDGFDIRLLSGDRGRVVALLAAALGIDDWRADCRPDDKIRAIQDLTADGRRVAMVGDGLNDAPALAAALVSLAPASGADLSQTAADLVFRGEALSPILDAIATARRAQSLVRQNIALAVAYNLIAVPIAFAGFVTPLIAAICMSASSLLVTANALRVQRVKE